MTKTKPGKIYFVTPVAYMPLDNEKHPDMVVCLLSDLIEAQKKHREEVATTRRKTVEECIEVVKYMRIKKEHKHYYPDQYRIVNEILGRLDQLSGKQEV